MIMKKYLYFMAAATVALAACTKEISPDEPQFSGKVIKALNDDGITSKTTLADDNEILWTDSDAVTAFVGTTKHTSASTAVSNGGKVATFTFNDLDSSAEVDYLIYPADANASISEGVVSTTLTTLQRIVPGSFANGANLAIAEGAEEVFFKNACSFLSVKVNGDNIHSVKLIADQPLTGEVTVNYNEGNPIVAAKEGGKTANYVQLAGTFVSGGTYYFIVLPGSYTGIKLEFTDVQGRKATFTNSEALTVARNENLEIADITISSEKWQNPVIENAINMRQARLFPKWEGAQLGTVSAFTLETLVKFNQFDHDSSTKVYNLMGMEGTFNCRVRRDISSYSGKNILQVSNANKLNVTSNEISTDRWYHMAVTFDNGAVKVYYDGELVAETSNIGASSIDLSPAYGNDRGSFWYGHAYDNNRWFDGQMAEMRIWTKALSAEEINAPGHFYFVDPSSEGLFSYWTLCTPSGNYVLDATGHGNPLYGQRVPGTWSDGINWAADIAHSISVSPTEKSFSADATSFDIEVTAQGDWTVSGTPAWLSLSASSGNGNATVTVSSEANTGDKREATLTFTCGTHEATVAVTQQAANVDEPLTLKSGSSPKNYYFNQFNSSRTYAKGGTLTWEIVDNDQPWTATLYPEGAGASLSYDTATKKVTLTVSDAASATRDIKCWTVTVARPADTKPIVLCAYMQNYVKNSKPALCCYDMTDDSFSDGTYVISSMDSGNTRPYPLWNGISSNEARTYDLQCFLWTRSAGEKDPASFWYPTVSRISTVRVETLFDIKAKGDGTYTIRPVGNTACGLGAVDGHLAIAAECVNASWTITKGSFGWIFKCGDLYLVPSVGTKETGTSYKALDSCTALHTLSLSENAPSVSADLYVRLFKVAYADTHAGNVEFATPDITEEVTSDGGTKSVTIHTTPTWTASVDVDWITLGATSGTGVENTLSYTVAANSTGSARTGIITVTSNGSSCRVIVNQQ